MYIRRRVRRIGQELKEARQYEHVKGNNSRMKCQRDDHWFCAVREQTLRTKNAPTRMECRVIEEVVSRLSREEQV
jgi:hypothetical protein